ncbi:MAG: 50S ribosomal protein L9 [Bacteroidia bacterium]|nr:50S ribosomal protein L9 [Bacteroidia bacterium]MDW8334096.1 50S ribosomal protein L9 [Bacteroidia bacterium]
MKVILLEDVANLGDKDDVVEVKPGYANNYLIPKRFAVVATPSALKQLEENKRQAAHRQQKIKDDAAKLAELISSLNLQIPMLVGKGGKIYGSVTPIMLAGALKEKGFDVDRRKIILSETISTLGSYTAVVNLHKEIKAELKFEVVEKTPD